MLKHAVAALAAGLLVGISAGCSVVTLHPVAGDQALPYDATLAGLWKAVGDSDVYRITQGDDHTYRYCEIKDESKNCTADCCGRIQLLEAGGEMFADIIPDGGVVPLHLIARVRLSPDQIRIAILDKVDPKTPLMYEMVGKDNSKQLVFTASTAELQAALPKLAAMPGAFGDEAVLLRMKTAP